MLESVFRSVFDHLADVGYGWRTQSPDRLKSLRSKDSSTFDPLTRYFGLGLEIEDSDFLEAGFSSEAILQIRSLHPVVSLSHGKYLAHDQWPGPALDPESWVYLGLELFSLLDWIEPDLEIFRNSSVLDLGSGSGVLSFRIAEVAKSVLGLEASEKAVNWAQAGALAQNLQNLRFAQAQIGEIEADARVGHSGWDFALFNPPMTLPRPGRIETHRAGGLLGVEVPLLFLDFAGRHLHSKGEVFCLMTNPIRNGKEMIFSEIQRRGWKVISSLKLDSHFNQSLAKKERYADMGVDRIELWAFRLGKKSN